MKHMGILAVLLVALILVHEGKYVYLYDYLFEKRVELDVKNKPYVI